MSGRAVTDDPPPFECAPRVLIEVARDVPSETHLPLASELTNTVSRCIRCAARVERLPQGAIASGHKTERVLGLYGEQEYDPACFQSGITQARLRVFIE